MNDLSSNCFRSSFLRPVSPIAPIRRLTVRRRLPFP
jgi:hypothetical protein